MDYLDFYFSHLDEIEKLLLVAESAPNENLPDLNTDIMSLSDVYFTIDPVTDNIENPVNKLLSSTLSPLERDKIMAFLQPLPRSKRHNLSDEDLVNMLPSRYNTTLTDMDAVRDFFENNILNEVDAQDVDQGQQGQQAQQAQQGE